MRMILAALFALTLLVSPASAQHDHHHEDSTPAASADDVTAAASETMGNAMVESAHMRMTALRPANAKDSARATAVLTELRRGIVRYQDYRTAVADGYKVFLPNVPMKVYHFTSYGRAFLEGRRFDPRKPTSLLYERTADGGYRLVGAMFVARRDATADQLHARIPLSVAQWHAHTNICVPKLAERRRWRETREGKMKFGPAGAIATREDCAREGGRFHPQIFGWMVHVNPWAADPWKHH